VAAAYQEIKEFELSLTNSGIILLKFWLHLSKEEQLRRFEERQKIEYKQYKITDEDWRNREKWDDYRQAVVDMITNTSTTYAPWTIVEANDKLFARIKVLETICNAIDAGLGQKKGDGRRREGRGQGQGQGQGRRQEEGEEGQEEVVADAAPTLAELGWTDALARHLEPFAREGMVAARVAVEHRTKYGLYTERGEIEAALTGTARHERRPASDRPAVGDWVAVAVPRPRGGRDPRGAASASAFTRKVAGASTRSRSSPRTSTWRSW